MTKRADGRYQESILVDGKRKYFYGKTKREALAKMNDFIKQSEEQITFRDMAESWQRVHREEIGDKTWMNYRPHYDDIVSRHGDTPISEITTIDVNNDLKRAKARGCSATIISTRRSLYRMILDHAITLGHINYNPAVAAHMPRGIVRNRRDPASDDIIATIMSNVDKPFGLFPFLLACTGLRKAEALALTWGDIRDDHIIVNKALDYTVHAHPVCKEPKTKAGNRVVPILDILKPHLVRPKNASANDLVFPARASNRSPNADGQYMTQRAYDWAWRRYCSATGMVDENGNPLFTAHQLRHSMATQLFNSGADQLTAQLILGHASPTTTREIYTHLTNQQQAKSVDKLNAEMSKLMSKHS